MTEIKLPLIENRGSSFATRNLLGKGRRISPLLFGQRIINDRKNDSRSKRNKQTRREWIETRVLFSFSVTLRKSFFCFVRQLRWKYEEEKRLRNEEKKIWKRKVGSRSRFVGSRHLGVGWKRVLKAFIPQRISPLERDTSCHHLFPRLQRQVALFGGSHVTRWIMRRAVRFLCFAGDYLRHTEGWYQLGHGERTRDFQPFAHSESDRGRRRPVHLFAE